MKSNSLIRYFKYIVFIIVFVFGGNIYALPIKHLQFDSTVVKTIKPSKAAEAKVFKEVDLDFARKTEDKDIGLWSRFWNWLLESLFGDADFETRLNAQKIVMWVLAIAGLILIIWLLTRSQFTGFLRGNTKNVVFSFSDLEEDISKIDFDTRTRAALEENDYRSAIRWLYLKQLYVMNMKGVISYQPHKTNIDYAQELANTTFKASFKSISYIYDYVWYGKYSITLKDFHVFEAEFNQFEKAF